MNTRVTALFGLSGVGKTTLARHVANEYADLVHAEAGAILASALRLEREQLRLSPPDTIRGNQRVLLDAFDALRKRNPGRPILFEGHLVIDNGVELVEVPIDVVRALQPQMLIWVFDDPSVIAKRRSESSRTRPARTSEELAAQQARGETLCREYSVDLQVPFEHVHVDGCEKLLKLVAAPTRAAPTAN